LEDTLKPFSDGIITTAVFNKKPSSLQTAEVMEVNDDPHLEDPLEDVREKLKVTTVESKADDPKPWGDPTQVTVEEKKKKKKKRKGGRGGKAARVCIISTLHNDKMLISLVRPSQDSKRILQMLL
jgi:hypothetical protein